MRLFQSPIETRIHRDVRRRLKSYSSWLGIKPPYTRHMIISAFGYDARTIREVEETRELRHGIKTDDR